MSFLVDQVIHGKVYVYRAENYWDKQTKKEKQRRVYIGRRDETTGEIIPKQVKHPVHTLSELSSSSVLTVRDSGAIWLLDQISDQVGLTKVLKEAFPSLGEDLLGLAYYQVCESKPLYLYQDWLYTVSLSSCHSLSSQTISDVCEELGSHEEHIYAFFEEWIRYQWNVATGNEEKTKHPKEKELETGNLHPNLDPDSDTEQNTTVPSLYLDITSLSVFGKQNDFAQWGYNRDHEPLPQVNVGMVVHEATNLPLAYRLLPGSVPDVSSLKTTLTFLQELGLSPTRFVLDRGFYSQQNLLQMKQAGIAFLLPLSLSSRLASSLFAQAGEKLLSPSHAFTFQHNVLFHQRIPLFLQEEEDTFMDASQRQDTEGKETSEATMRTKKTSKRGKPPSSCFLPPVSCIAHLYFDETRRAKEIESFYQRLTRVEEMVHRRPFRSFYAVKDEIEEIAPGWMKYWTVEWDPMEHIATLTRKDQTIATHTHHFGKMALLSSEPFVEKEEALWIYRRRDAIEKLFDTQKNELNQSRIRVHSRTAMTGRLFLSFLSIILYCALLQKLKTTSLHKKLTVPEILMTLRSIRQIKRKDGNTFYTEITKKQRNILEAFQVSLPGS